MKRPRPTIQADHRIIIVDPYSSGAMLADEIKKRGAACIAVESSRSLPAAMKSRFNPAAFLDVVQHDSDLNMTLQALVPHHPTHVIAGFESGVELADLLAERLSLLSNAPQWRQARRDKFLMNEAVRSAGLRTATQFRSNRTEEILQWIQATLEWPVVLKPPKSVATDLVFYCNTNDEVRRAADAILSETNILGNRNPTVVVQEFLDGIEYAVDVVSFAGQKRTTAYWQYHRPEGLANRVGYDSMTLLPYAGEKQQAMQAYAFSVLDALGIRFGPAHCELMWVDGEPILIEANARLSAGNNAVLSRLCGGICQLDQTVQAILDPDRFLATLNSTPRLDRQAVNVFLSPKQRGRLIGLHGIDEIRQLPTVYSMSVSANIGEQLGRVAGLVTLIDPDLTALQRDVAVIRALEEQGIFEVEQGVPA